jgi:hypothetical protein
MSCASGTNDATARLGKSPLEYRGHKHANSGALPVWMIFRDSFESIFPLLASVIHICNHAVDAPIEKTLDATSCAKGERARAAVDDDGDATRRRNKFFTADSKPGNAWTQQWHEHSRNAAAAMTVNLMIDVKCASIKK